MRALSLAVLFCVGVFSRSTTATSTTLLHDASRQLLQESISLHLHRTLQENNNDESFTLSIPDIRVETEVLSSDLTVDLTAIECRDLIIQQVQVELQAPMGNGIPVFVALSNVNITCRADYEYQFLFGSGGGVVELDAYDMAVESQVVFISPNLATQPPNAAWFNDCQSKLHWAVG